ncbi:MAG: HAMP domain-containing histidine kinase, partial [Chloroflexi bacterium]|nr:HAMP domain-containing histidine kinase [Chloroflexota bacterium]
ITASTVELWVADAGDGVAPEDLPHIFEPFYRGDRSRSRRRGGSGLGLTMVRAIVRAHGGRIRAQTQTESGARFVITLPTESSTGTSGDSFAVVGQGIAQAASGSDPAPP